MRSTASVLAFVIVAVPAVSTASNVFGGDEIVVAVLDTGIRPTHQEFDYGGPANTDDQIVAWWDFTSTHRSPKHPAPGQVWDDEIAHPYDDNGHGTATAALAVGNNVASASEMKHSHFPGGKLAVARVCGTGGTCDGVAQAIEWASATVGADVISISIGSNVVWPQMLANVHEAARVARARGTLVVVSNGNGFANAAGPQPGWATTNGNSTNVLSVGASGVIGLLAGIDPEVAADYASVPVARNGCDDCYGTSTGTSFSAPSVAGMVARAMEVAVANGRDASPDAIESLIKHAARDTAIPPTYEGYGVIDAATEPVVDAHAAAGTLPVRPDPDLSAIYVEQVAGSLREAWSETLDEDHWGWYEVAGASSPVFVLGTSWSPGVAEAETFTVSLEAGESLAVSVAAAFEFFELQVFEGTGPDALRGRSIVANNRYGVPSVTFRAHEAGEYTVLVGGFSVAVTLPYSITSWSSVRGDDVLTFDRQATYVATAVYTA